MKEGNSRAIYFYPSKIKYVSLIILGIVFAVGGIAMCYSAFKNDDYTNSLIGAGIAIFFGLPIPFVFKVMIDALPYLCLTEKELIINPLGKNPLPIKRVDIKGYRMLYIRFNTFIEIILYDEEKYTKHMSKTHRKLNSIGTMGGHFSLFNIALGQIKVSERDLLFYALDNIDSPYFDVENVPSSKILKTMNSFTSQINQEYFMKNYLLSLIIFIFSMLLFYWGDNDMASLNYVITSFVLFPFAKLLFDVMIGFKLKSSVKKQSKTMNYMYQLIYIVYFVLFLVSPFVGPVGILYLITRSLHRWIKKRNDNP